MTNNDNDAKVPLTSTQGRDNKEVKENVSSGLG